LRWFLLYTFYLGKCCSILPRRVSSNASLQYERLRFDYLSSMMLLLLASRIHPLLHLCRLLLFLSYVHGVVYDTFPVLALTCYFPPSLIIWFFRKDFSTIDPHFNT